MIHRRTRLLAQTCFGRLFENDLFSSSMSASNGVVWLLAALATPGVMFSGSQYYFYAHARTFAPEAQDRILFVSQAFHVDFGMAVAGLVTMLVWTSITPDRLDALVLGHLPLRPGEQARARLLALTQFFAMFAVALAVPTAVAFTFVTVGEASLGDVLGRVAGHVGAVMLGAGFVFFVLIDVQLMLAAVLGPAAVRATTFPLQLAALMAMVGALSFTPRMADALLGSQAAANVWVVWNPAAWFVGVYRWTAGDPNDVFLLLAERAVLACGLAVAMALIAYPMAHQRCLRYVISGEGRRASWWSDLALVVWLRMLSLWLRAPLERGLATFITATVTRSPAHRFLLGGYAGIAVLFALPLTGRLLGPATTTAAMYAWFAIPLGLLCWLSAGLRVALMIPIEPSSSWAFKLAEPVDKRRVLSTTVTLIQGATAVPLSLLFGVASGLTGGPVLGVTVWAVVFATGIALVELLTLTLRTVPCACTYRPGQLRLRVFWPVYLGVWILVAHLLPRMAVRAVGDLATSAWLIAALLTSWVALRVWRLARARRLAHFVYDEVDPGVATKIDLSSVRG